MNASAQVVYLPYLLPTPTREFLQVQPKSRTALKPMKPSVGPNFGLFFSSATFNFSKRFMADPDIQIPKQNKIQEQLINVVKQLKAMWKLRDNWDGFGAAAPNSMAFRAAHDVLLALHEAALMPTDIEPSVEEGITFTFVNGDKYAFLEIYNEGDIAVGHFEGDKDPVAYEFKDTFEQVTQATQKVLEFING